jgi:hypothetical protein
MIPGDISDLPFNSQQLPPPRAVGHAAIENIIAD